MNMVFGENDVKCFFFLTPLKLKPKRAKIIEVQPRQKYRIDDEISSWEACEAAGFDIRRQNQREGN